MRASSHTRCVHLHASVLGIAMLFARRRGASLARNPPPAASSVPFLTPLSEADSAATPARGACVIHTGYAPRVNPGMSAEAVSRTTARHTVPVAAPAVSYKVTDVAAMDAIIAEAVHASVEEVSLPVPARDKQRGNRKKKSGHAPATERVAAVAHTALSRRWLASYQQDKGRLESLLHKKAPIDRYVDQLFYPALKYGCFALMGLQLGLYFNWIFFVFDWNLMEPTTYFLAYSAVYCSLVYHYLRCGYDEFTWKNLFVYWADKERTKMCERAHIDLVELTALQLRVKTLEEEIAKYEIRE